MDELNELTIIENLDKKQLKHILSKMYESLFIEGQKCFEDRESDNAIETFSYLKYLIKDSYNNKADY